MTITALFSRVTFSVVLCGALLGSAAAHSASSKAPEAPRSGTFVVNSAADSNVLDNNLTLREALAVANGSLTGSFSAAEQAQLGGCIFSGGMIIGGCGAGFDDTINFASAYTITLLAPLPAISDSAPMTLNSCYNAHPCVILEAGGLVAGSAALSITSDSNAVWGLQVQNSPGDGFRILGDANLLEYTKAYSSAGSGIHILSGGNNVIDSATIGFKSSASETCHPNQTGIRLTSGATGNRIQYSRIACSTGAGILVNASGGNIIGPSTSLGYGYVYGWPNNVGILINNGSFRNEITSTTVAYSLGNGIEITGANGTVIVNNTVVGNGRNGIAIYNASSTSVGGRYLDRNTVDGNRIGGNGRNGIVISGTANSTDVLGNTIGNYTGYPASTPNNANAGILVTDGAYQNTIGNLRGGVYALGRGGNVIGGNSVGVQISNGANNNTLLGNDIGRSATSPGAPLNIIGVQLDNGAYNTTLGAVAPNYFNVIAGNGSGIVVSGANRINALSNIIGLSTTLVNTSTGISLRNTTTNTWTGNQITFNGGDGVRVMTGTTNNSFIGGSVSSNGANGFNLITATLNTITATTIAGNAGSGIRANTGATLNFWSHLAVRDNGGLGIDKMADTIGTNTPNPPTGTINSVNRATGVITGTSTGTAFFIVTSVQLYRAAPDPSGYGEGAQYVGSDTTDSAGVWSITDPDPVARQYSCYTLLVDAVAVIPLGTSEFGNGTCRPASWLPLTFR
ncbi:MAG: right-handed parallel beta-helix repeat-containing protein [Thermoflexales bacterium]|nr:right-handed parallel beta-helix repeat-containing protein [Thermoflexales bacterium]